MKDDIDLVNCSFLLVYFQNLSYRLTARKKRDFKKLYLNKNKNKLIIIDTTR